MRTGLQWAALPAPTPMVNSPPALNLSAPHSPARLHQKISPGQTRAARNRRRPRGTVCAMSFYPATIVAVTDTTATARIDATGHQIVLPHSGHNAVPAPLRHIGAQGFISFPKAPPVFTATAASASESELPSDARVAA